MAAQYVHGVETLEYLVGPQPVTVVKSSIIALIGIAPKGPVNELTLISSPDNAISVFGQELPGFNIPEALSAIFAQGSGLVMVLNVLNSENLTDVVAENVVVGVGGVAATAFAPVGVLVLKSGATTLVANTDYLADAFGNVTILKRLLYPDGTTLTASYKKLVPGNVTPAQIFGGVDPVTNDRTGTACFDLALGKFGFNPKVFIAPHYSELLTVANELTRLATKYRGIVLKDAPEGTKLPAALDGRAALTSLGGFASTNQRDWLWYPRLKRPDPAGPLDSTGQPTTDKLVPFSALLAGVISATDLAYGFWYVASNKPIQGVTGVELPLSVSWTDPTSDIQRLNAAGIGSVFTTAEVSINGNATVKNGYLTFGSRSAAFPSNLSVFSFIAVRRTADIIEDFIEQDSARQFTDSPVNTAGLDTVRMNVITYLNSLRQRGAILAGTCLFLPEDNPLSDLQQGIATFAYDFMPPTSLELMRFKATININYLKTLVGGN